MLHGLQQYFSFITNDVVQAGIGLSGGGARSTVGSCGAFSGGIMALSLKLTPRSEELSPKEQKEFDKARNIFGEFRDWFIGEFGSVVCRDVQHRLYGRSFNLMDDKERQAFGDFRKNYGDKCPVITTKSAVKIAELLMREG